MIPPTTGGGPGTTGGGNEEEDEDGGDNEVASTPDSDDTGNTGGIGGSGTGAGSGEPTDTTGDGSDCEGTEEPSETAEAAGNSSVGDRVKVAPGTYSDVFMFSHKTAGVKYEFVTIETQAGDVLSATAGHYIYINGGLAAARTAKTPRNEVWAVQSSNSSWGYCC